eukprot:1193066-Prorocentrum_minimum.AAC.4
MDATRARVDDAERGLTERAAGGGASGGGGGGGHRGGGFGDEPKPRREPPARGGVHVKAECGGHSGGESGTRGHGGAGGGEVGVNYLSLCSRAAPVVYRWRFAPFSPTFAFARADWASHKDLVVPPNAPGLVAGQVTNPREEWSIYPPQVTNPREEWSIYPPQ